ncbi:hypothetical protein [Streptomyces sp. NPDC058620]|uniref:hypothetical protein n=1 Tax=Streptomyces sp. NPDC058620 TaxID=3346560 RepID=UPI00365481ED
MTVLPPRQGTGDDGATEFAALMTMPGLVIGLTVLAFVDQILLRAGRAGVLPWRNSARQGPGPVRPAVRCAAGVVRGR